MPVPSVICGLYAGGNVRRNAMAKCIKCGKEASSCLCDNCRPGTDLEKLCKQIITFRPGIGENPLWEEICSGMNNPYNFSSLVFALSDELPTPRKEYLRVMAIAGTSSNVPKASRPWFYETYDVIRESDSLTEEEKNRLSGIAVGARYMDYDYEAAERIASVLCASQNIPWQASYNLAEFYTTTRRYDAADDVIEEALSRFANDEFVVQTMQNLAEKNAKQHEKANAGKQEYLPNPKENREEVRKKYIDFLASIGIEVTAPAPSAGRKSKAAIPRDQYPDPIETRDTDFDTFVAFDLETTGRSSKTDSIIEIGAVKVVGGQIVDTDEYIFQELVQPLDHKKVTAEITELTGITNEEVYVARPIWEVLPDFKKFAGDAVLVGFNCMVFDSRFMVRAGRYSNTIIDNKYFDVMRYAAQFKEQLGIDARKVSLKELSGKLEIENPRAHRALSDAITTARIFLKLKELDTGTDSSSVEDMLSDLDNW